MIRRTHASRPMRLIAVLVALGLATTAAPSVAATPTPDIKVTQNASETPEDFTSVACNNGMAENHYYRRFDLAGDYGISGGFAVSAVGYGYEYVQSPNGPLQLDVKIWAIDPADALSLAELEPVGSGFTTATAADNLHSYSLAVTGTVPAGKDMVLELSNAALGAGEQLWVAANGGAQSDPSYTYAPICNSGNLVTWASLGFSTSLLLFAYGKAGECTDAETLLTNAEAALTVAQDAKATAQSAVTDAEASVATKQSAADQAQAQADVADALVATAQAKVAAATKAVKKAKKRLKKAKASGDAAKITKAKRKLKAAKKRLKTAKAALVAAQGQASTAHASLAQAQSALADAEAALTQAQADLSAAQTALANATQAAIDADGLVSSQCAQPAAPPGSPRPAGSSGSAPVRTLVIGDGPQFTSR